MHPTAAERLQSDHFHTLEITPLPFPYLHLPNLAASSAVIRRCRVDGDRPRKSKPHSGKGKREGGPVISSHCSSDGGGK